MALPKIPLTTGIGSLPHHNVDAALAFAFQCSVPFLSQIPIRNPWEYMIAGALEGLPGLQVEKEGVALLNIDVWSWRSKAFNDKLLNAYASISRPDAFDAFEPSPAASSCWQPFLWELKERKYKFAKIQIAGPLTAQWSLKLSNGSHIDRHPDLSAQIYRLVMARAIAMGRRLLSLGIEPVLYLDEPGLYTFDPASPRHALAWQEIKLMVRALQKENIRVGLHCCSNASWTEVLALGVDILSIDVALSLPSLLSAKPALTEFIQRGGRMSLGVLPTTLDADLVRRLTTESMLTVVREPIFKAFADESATAEKLLGEAIYTPACGLALHTTTDAEYILSLLLSFERRVKEK